jgi:signal transduction histidine kinase/CheY-like chemotaxis protein
VDDSEIVLVWAPRGRDATLTVRALARYGLVARECIGLDDLLEGIERHGCAILTAETLTHDGRDALAERLARQPAWSDFPLVLFAPPRADVADRGLEEVKALGNVSILERPVQPGTLVSAVRSALRARRRQYEAREAILRRDQFLAMLGHELRNPLAAIMLALEMMPVNTGCEKQRAIVDRQTHHLKRLVEDLLDVARVTSGKVRLERQIVDLTEIVQRCVESAELAAKTRVIEVVFTHPDVPMLVDGDTVRLEEIFNNLISNSIKYSPTGSRIDVRARCEDADCIVDIIDRGIGIPSEMLPRVFDLFTQVEGSLARSQGGLGIGLTLVKSLVDLHEGTIVALSPGLGLGSTFTVRLPNASGSSARETSPQDVASPAGMRVVLVEDNLDLLDMIRELLESCGCQVATAPDGTSGLELLLRQQPDIAFVDIGLPGIDGFQVAERLRARDSGETYLVAMSGYGQPDDQKRALDAGFDRHLTKPVTADALREAMGTARRARA